MARSSFRFIGLAFLMLVAFDNNDSSAAAQAPANGTVRMTDPCRLLTPNEVEAVIGPLAGPPYRAAGAVPRPKGQDCRYEAAGGRSIRVAVTWDHGAEYMQMMGAMAGMLNAAGLHELKLSNSSTVAGGWDKAHVSQCCEFNALLGDQMVTIDIAGSHATIAQAAGLADAAVRRLAQPLDIDGAAGIKLAEERAAARPKRRSVCDLVTQADAEAIAGVALLASPKGDEESCLYVWPLDASGSRYSVKLMVQWTDGFHEMRLVSSMTGQASSMFGLGKSCGQTPAADAGPWDEFSQSIIGVMAVKSDVLASIESGPFRQDIARAFVEKAVVNLSK